MTGNLDTLTSLAQDEERFRLLIEHTLDIVTILDAEGIVRYESPSLEKHFGYTPAELIGKSAFDFIHPKDVKAVMAKFGKLLSEPGTSESAEFRFMHKDGSWHYLESIGISLLHDPVVKGVLVNSRVTTRRKRIEEALEKRVKIRTKKLERANEKLSKELEARTYYEKQLETSKEIIESEKLKDTAILASIGEGLIVVNNRDIITRVNSQAEHFLKTSARELLGREFVEVIPIEDRHGRRLAREERPLYRTDSLNRVQVNDDYYYVRKDGTRFPISGAITSMVLNGRKVGKVVTFRDVTEEKELEETKNDFVSVASHQLRTPLSTVNWYSETLLMRAKERKLSAKERKYLKEIHTANQRMIRLVNELLNVSRIELGTLTPEFAPFHIMRVVKEVLHEFRTPVKRAGIVVREKYDRHLPPIEIDPRFMQVILQNLISNAIKYTPSEKEEKRVDVHVRYETPEACVVISIGDNGYGIPKDVHGNIFNKFFRADNIRLVDQDGTGLGLYITKQMVELMRGRIWFESKVGEGTTFYVAFPVMTEKIIEKRGTHSHTGAPSFMKQKGRKEITSYEP